MKSLMLIMFTYTLVVACTPAKSSAHSADREINLELLSALCAGDYDSTTAPEAVMARLLTLCSVWYPDADLPQPKSRRKVAKACAPLIEAAHTEYVRDSLMNDPLLCWYATYDHDGDDIVDFRLSADGYFIENDPDVDGDGIENLRDTETLKENRRPEESACDERTISAKFDWSHILDNGFYKASNTKDCDGKDHEACDIQQRLYKDYGVLVYERGAAFNLKTLYAVEDVLTRVFGSLFTQRDPSCGSLPTLKFVNTAACAEKTGDPFDMCGTEQYTLGEALAHNASMTLYQYGTQQSSMDLLSLLAHEFAHSWQFFMDEQNDEASAGLLQNYWKTPQFDEYLRDKEWKIAYKPEVQIEAERSSSAPLVFADHDVVAHDELSYRYREYPWLQLKADFDSVGLHHDHAPGGHISADRLRDAGVLGGYSMSGPWEWHGDSVAAYVLRCLENHMVAHSADGLGQRAADRLARLQRADWTDNFYYRNLSDDVFEALSRELPISMENRDALTCRYLVNSDDYLFDTNKLVFDDGALNPGEIVELAGALREDWASRCPQTLASN